MRSFLAMSFGPQRPSWGNVYFPHRLETLHRRNLYMPVDELASASAPLPTLSIVGHKPWPIVSILAMDSHQALCTSWTQNGAGHTRWCRETLPQPALPTSRGSGVNRRRLQSVNCCRGEDVLPEALSLSQATALSQKGSLERPASNSLTLAADTHYA